MWARTFLALFVALSSAVLPSDGSLFEDQKGSNNWLSQHVGRVQHATVLNGKPSVLVATEQGVLATLNLRDGAIQWRKNLLDEGISQLLVSERNNLAFTVDGNGSTLRAFFLSSAQLAWEVPLLSKPGKADASFVVAHLADAGDAEADDYVAVLSEKSVTAFSAQSGRVLWTRSKAIGKRPISAAIHKVGSFLFVAALDASMTRVDYVKLDASSGDTVGSATLQAPKPCSRSIVATDDAFLMQSQSGEDSCEIRLSGEPEGAAVKCQALPELAVTGPGRLSAGAHALVVERKGAGDGHVLLFDTKPSPSTLTQSMSGVAAVSDITSDGERPMFATASSAGSTVKLSVIGTDDGAVLYEESVKTGASGSNVSSVSPAARLWLGPYTRSNGKPGYLCLAVAEDDTLTMTRQKKVVWTREEAMASVQKALIVDLPAPGSPHAPVAKRPLSVSELLQLNILVLKSTLGLCSEHELAQIAHLKAAASNRFVGTRDVLGTRRLLLLLTERGKLFGLHSGDGRVLFSQHLHTDGLPVLAFHLYRMHHGNEPPQVLAVFSDGAKSRSAIVDVYTGAIVHEQALASPATQVLRLSARLQEAGGAIEQSIFILSALPFPAADTAPVQILPDTPAARALVRNAAAQTFLWGAKKATGEVAGYRLSRDVPDSGPLTARKVWGLSFPEPLLAVTPHEAPEAMIHHVKVLGDRSMRFRYLNTNAALLVTGLPDGVEAPEGSAPPDLSAYVIDTVTGRVLHQQVHGNARGPVAAAFFDNIAVLQFWDRASLRWQVSVMEIYDRSKPMPSVTSMMSSIGSAAVDNSVSSFTPVTLEVLKQSYHSKVGVRSMTATKTAHGITPRHILLATTNDQLYDMDSQLLDARRPKVQKLTPEQKEERLIPYASQLPLMPAAFASYDAQVLGIKHVIAGPAELESTTHIFAWGVDTYYVMLRPARGFDMLDEDFSFALLTVALIALLLGTVILHHIVRKQKVKAQWP